MTAYLSTQALAFLATAQAYFGRAAVGTDGPDLLDFLEVTEGERASTRGAEHPDMADDVWILYRMVILRLELMLRRLAALTPLTLLDPTQLPEIPEELGAEIDKLHDLISGLPAVIGEPITH